jgi:sialidase-1
VQDADRLGDGRGGWTDIALRRSSDSGKTWGKLQVICRNSTLGKDGKRDKSLEDSCQQPAPVADNVTGKIFFLSSPDNWFQRVIESSDDGQSFTPWAQATNLDSSLRKPGWGLVFNGLPGGVQLTSPNSHAGRLILCSSAYWSGGAKEPGYGGRITHSGDIGSRYSFSIISDDHGSTWRIGSPPVQPFHTTECSISQSFDGDGALYMYTRIWAHKPGEPRRGIAKSTDGGLSWSNATLRGLGDTAPDCEGSMISARVGNQSCFFVSSPYSASRANLSVQASCGATAPAVWSAPVVVDPDSSSYSSLVYTQGGELLDLFSESTVCQSQRVCLLLTSLDDMTAHSVQRWDLHKGSTTGRSCRFLITLVTCCQHDVLDLGIPS